MAADVEIGDGHGDRQGGACLSFCHTEAEARAVEECVGEPGECEGPCQMRVVIA